MARALTRDRHDVAQAVALADGDRTLQHDEHARTGLARREQAVAARVASHRAEPADARDLRLGQHRKHLMAAAGERAGEIVSRHQV